MDPGYDGDAGEMDTLIINHPNVRPELDSYAIRQFRAGYSLSKIS